MQAILVLDDGQCFVVNGVGGGFCFCEALVGEEKELTKLSFVQFAHGQGGRDDERCGRDRGVREGDELVAVLLKLLFPRVLLFF